MKKYFAFAVLSMLALSSTSFAGTITYYRLLSSYTSLRSLDVIQPPRDFHVKATSNGGGVTWSSKVEGKGKLCSDGKDWLDLNTGSAYSSNDQVKPAGPYVVGCKSGSLFTPSSTDVQQP